MWIYNQNFLDRGNPLKPGMSHRIVIPMEQKIIYFLHEQIVLCPGAIFMCICDGGQSGGGV
jgi:hypothetical protein